MANQPITIVRYKMKSNFFTSSSSARGGKITRCRLTWIQKASMKVNTTMATKNSHDEQLVMTGSRPVAKAGAKKFFAADRTIIMPKKTSTSLMTMGISN